jgi:dTDP-4-dehydrorhamnose reductase
MMTVVLFRIMRVLLTGASGLLGRVVAERLASRRDIEFTATAFSRAKAPAIRSDLTDPASLEALFGAVKPEIVIHAAAERRPDVVDKDPDSARAINVSATRMIAEACARYGAFLLYISTDYVFDGSNPPYFPDSPVNPINQYGRLKLEGERRIIDILSGGAAAMEAAILRIPLLYGPVERLDECSVTELATLLKKREPCMVDHWARRYPIHVGDVAEAILRIIDAVTSSPGRFEAARAACGLPVFLLSGKVAYTKYEMLMIMARVLGIDASFARPNSAPPPGAPRPKDCRMDTGLIESFGYKQLSVFEAEIRTILSPFFKG